MFVFGILATPASASPLTMQTLRFEGVVTSLDNGVVDSYLPGVEVGTPLSGFLTYDPVEGISAGGYGIVTIDEYTIWGGLADIQLPGLFAGSSWFAAGPVSPDYAFLFNDTFVLQWDAGYPALGGAFKLVGLDTRGWEGGPQTWLKLDADIAFVPDGGKTMLLLLAALAVCLRIPR